MALCKLYFAKVINESLVVDTIVPSSGALERGMDGLLPDPLKDATQSLS